MADEEEKTIVEVFPAHAGLIPWVGVGLRRGGAVFPAHAGLIPLGTRPGLL